MVVYVAFQSTFKHNIDFNVLFPNWCAWSVLQTFILHVVCGLIMLTIGHCVKLLSYSFPQCHVTDIRIPSSRRFINVHTCKQLFQVSSSDLVNQWHNIRVNASSFLSPVPEVVTCWGEQRWATHCSCFRARQPPRLWHWVTDSHLEQCEWN